MNEIDFLSGKKEHREKKEKRENVEWTKPATTENPEEKKSSGWFSFFGKKQETPNEPAKKEETVVNKINIDKAKLKSSREEILKLIKESQINKKDEHAKAPKKSKLNFLSWFKLPKRNKKEVLIDYQHVFKNEKEKKPKKLNFSSPAMPMVEKKPEIEEIKKAEITEVKKPEPEPEVKPEFDEKKEAKQEISQEKIKIKEPYNLVEKIKEFFSKLLKKQTLEQAKHHGQAEWENPDVLETNLIKGEIITFFDWKKKIISLAYALGFSCLIVAMVYFSINIFQSQKKEQNKIIIKQLSDLNLQIDQSKDNINTVLLFQNKLKLASELLSRHIYWSNFFKFLEDNTIASVYYVNFSGDTKGKYSIDAVANDYDSISQQVNAMKASDKVLSVSAKGGEAVQQGEGISGGVKFQLDMSVKPEIFIE